MFASPLTVLADRYGSDKGTAHGDRHRYTQLYDVLLHPYRHGIGKMLELGLARGGPEAEIGGRVERQVDSPSVAAWLEYFPTAEVYGFDISDFSHLEAAHPRFRFVRGDCGSTADLAGLRQRLGNDVDLIIDDASHASYHQQLALRELFPCLRSGGLYIIEDLHWQPAHIERALPATMPTLAWLDALRSGTGHLSPLWTEAQLRALADAVASLTLLSNLQVPGGRYINALAVLRKTS